MLTYVKQVKRTIQQKSEQTNIFQFDIRKETNQKYMNAFHT